jgi:hypothetical protein
VYVAFPPASTIIQLTKYDWKLFRSQNCQPKLSASHGKNHMLMRQCRNYRNIIHFNIYIRFIARPIHPPMKPGIKFARSSAPPNQPTTLCVALTKGVISLAFHKTPPRNHPPRKTQEQKPKNANHVIPSPSPTRRRKEPTNHYHSNYPSCPHPACTQP